MVGSNQVSFAFTSFDMPGGASEIEVSLDWRSRGHSDLFSKYDFMRIWLLKDDYVLTRGIRIVAGASSMQLGASEYLNNANFVETLITVNTASFAGQNVRLVFEWINNAAQGNQPPAAVDNILIKQVLCSAPTDFELLDSSTTSLTHQWEEPESVVGGS